jgi:multicomponent Na+:H+ antiporter subunit E
MTGPVLLALGIWMLFTADFSWPNVVVGLFASLLVSMLNRHRFSAWQLACLILTALIRLPWAIWESFLIVVIPHRHERVSFRRISDPENPWAIFCQTFIITFTPRSLVVGEEKNGQLQLHSLEKRELP